MKCLTLGLLLLSLMRAACAEYSWSRWATDAPCVRKCSEQSGVQMLKRKCLKCTRDDCVTTDDAHCQGDSKKNNRCYVADSCTGSGPFVGVWSPWVTEDSCPPADHPCKGKEAQHFVRWCTAPSMIGYRLPFRCPDEPTEKTVFCDCQTYQLESSAWNRWAAWSECGCTTKQQVRVRHCLMAKGEACRGPSSETRFCNPDMNTCNPDDVPRTPASPTVSFGDDGLHATGNPNGVTNSGPVIKVMFPVGNNKETDHVDISTFKKPTPKPSGSLSFGIFMSCFLLTAIILAAGDMSVQLCIRYLKRGQVDGDQNKAGW